MYQCIVSAVRLQPCGRYHAARQCNACQCALPATVLHASGRVEAFCTLPPFGPIRPRIHADWNGARLRLLAGAVASVGSFASVPRYMRTDIGQRAAYVGTRPTRASLAEARDWLQALIGEAPAIESYWQ